MEYNNIVSIVLEENLLDSIETVYFQREEDLYFELFMKGIKNDKQAWVFVIDHWSYTTPEILFWDWKLVEGRKTGALKNFIKHDLRH